MIAGHLTLSPERRDEFVAAHADLVQRARAYPGCLDLSISGDPFDPARVNLMEFWESEEILEAWRKISNPPETGISIMDGAVQKHFISRSTTPF
jgi:quinol monooxygenase YgiN